MLLKNAFSSVLQPKKSAKVKPRPPVGPHPCNTSLGPSSMRHPHRLFRTLPQINHVGSSSTQLPPILDHESIHPSVSSAATASAHMSMPRRPPPSFPSPSCYMLQEEEAAWETCSPFAKIRPPPKVSRLDIGSTRLMRDCVYPQLPPLYIRGPPEATFDPVDPAAQPVGLGLLEEAAGMVAPTQTAASFGELSDPLSLDVPTQTEGGCQSLEVGAQHQLPLSSPPLSTWTLATSNTLSSRADRTQLGTSFHMSPPPTLPASSSPSASARSLLQPFDATRSCLKSNFQAQSSTPVNPDNTFSRPSASSTPPLLLGVKVESPDKRPELISKREAGGVPKMTNQACKEPLGALKNAELLASLTTRASENGSSDGFIKSLGVASGQGSLVSRLPSIPANTLLQDDIRHRQMSPLHRTAGSYMVRP